MKFLYSNGFIKLDSFHYQHIKRFVKTDKDLAQRHLYSVEIHIQISKSIIQIHNPYISYTH